MKWLKIFAWLVGGIAVAYGLWTWTVSMGEEAARKLALEYSYCTTPGCDEGAKEVFEFVEAKSGYSRPRIAWCFGVDDWADTEVRRGGFFKSILVETMYMPCSALLE